jgi:hypothetical protein
MAALAGVRGVPARSASERNVPPSATTSRNSWDSVPACGYIAEWYFSAPARDCRHWKKQTASAPWATWVSESRSSSPGFLARLIGCQLTALVECSMRNHGRPPARLPVRLAENDSSSSVCSPGSR